MTDSTKDVVIGEYENQLDAAIYVANKRLSEHVDLKLRLENLATQFDADDGTDVGGALAFAAIKIRSVLADFDAPMTSRRVDQTILSGDPNRQGNCLSACVATLLGCELELVPHFVDFGVEHNGPNDNTMWWGMLLGFLAGHGLTPRIIRSVEEAPGELLFVMGPSPRGVTHQVIYFNGELWHDPHPSRAGLTSISQVWRFVPARFDHQPTVVVA